jgi:phospholipid transport system transporter-binding protein
MVNTKADLVRQGDGLYQLTGELDFESVPGVLVESKSMFNEDQEDLLVDLSGVRRCNSAALGLVLEWICLARQQQRKIRFRNLPNDLLAIALVSYLDTFLPIDNGF